MKDKSEKEEELSKVSEEDDLVFMNDAKYVERITDEEVPKFNTFSNGVDTVTPIEPINDYINSNSYSWIPHKDYGYSSKGIKKSKKAQNVTKGISIENIFKFCWECINSSKFTDFQVLSNSDYYRKNIIDGEFVKLFVNELKNNRLIIPLKIVNITNLNTYNFVRGTKELELNLRQEFNINMYCQFILPSLTTEGNNFKYDKDILVLELSQHSTEYKTFKKDTLEYLNKVLEDVDIIKNKVNAKIKSNPEYHKLVYKKNKTETSIKILENQIRTLNKQLYLMDKEFLNSYERESKDDDYEWSLKRGFFNCLEQVSRNTEEIEDGPYSVNIGFVSTTEQLLKRLRDIPVEFKTTIE